jgi:hypothetical protein
LAQTTVDLAGATPSLVQAAATWLECFHPGVAVTISPRSISLESNAHDEAQLRRIWRASMLNEQLVAASSNRRRETLETLVR